MDFFHSSLFLTSSEILLRIQQIQWGPLPILISQAAPCLEWERFQKSRTYERKMNRACTIGLFVAVLSSLGLSLAHAAPDFQREIQPLLQKYCIKCHGPEKAKGGVNFDLIKSQEQSEHDPKRLETMTRLLRDREMPPPGKTQPGETEREQLLAWCRHTLDHLDYDKIPKDPGRAIIHRLNRAEYNNTVRDLFGVDLH